MCLCSVLATASRFRRFLAGPAALSLVIGGGVVLAGAGPAGAEIQVKTLEDGTRMIYNESSTQRARRHAGNLLPVPDGELETIIRRSAFEQGLSPRLVQAVVQVESGYNPKALSHKGAMGLMQLMPATARLLGVADPWNPVQNVRGGARYLREQIDRFGDLTLALAAYNAGPTAVSRHGGVPPYAETQRYVQKVLGLYQSEPPELLQIQAREDARAREEHEEAIRKAEAESRGAQVYVTRDENGIVFTTAPPDTH